jgi:hypothetical protein
MTSTIPVYPTPRYRKHMGWEIRDLHGTVVRMHPHAHAEGPPLDTEIADWATGDDTSIGSLVDLFGSRAFAVVFVILLAPSALPIPTGGVTHILEIAAMLIALQLLVGRTELWVPQKWRHHQVATEGRFMRALVRFVHRVDRVAKPRMSYLFGRRFSNVAFGGVVLLGVLGAFLAPPFSGLDTLPSLGVVVVSLAMLFRDALIAAIGLTILLTGIVLEIVLGRVALAAAQSLWPF